MDCSKLQTVVVVCVITSLTPSSSVSNTNATTELDASTSPKEGQATQNNSRIVGGTVLKEHSWPFLVLLRMGFYFCGGAVYNDSYILTAAHCVNKCDVMTHSISKTVSCSVVLSSFNLSSLTVTAGEHNVSVNEGHEQTRNVTGVFVHPAYISLTLEQDIALLKLSSPLDLTTRFVQLIDINTDIQCPGNDVKCYVAGWGTHYYGGSASDVPYEVDLSIISNEKCNALSHVDYHKNIFDFHICAGNMTHGGHDSCSGDSGGPLVCVCGGKTMQVGIVSWGVECASQFYPGVYTRTSYYKNWILYGTEDFGNGSESHIVYYGTILRCCVLYLLYF